MEILHLLGLQQNFISLLCLLVFGHFLFDYPLQGDFMAKAKNKNNQIPGVPWRTVLVSHSFMHGVVVYLVTQQAIFGFVEFIIHTLLDHQKCENRITFNEDQLWHLFCKAVYAGTTAVIFHFSH